MSSETDQSYSGQSTWANIIRVEGPLVSGGKFALLMLIGGYLIEKSFEDQSLSDYLTAGETWYRTLFYFFFFGIFVGLDSWFRKEWKGVKRS